MQIPAAVSALPVIVHVPGSRLSWVIVSPGSADSVFTEPPMENESSNFAISFESLISVPSEADRADDDVPGSVSDTAPSASDENSPLHDTVQKDASRNTDTGIK